MIKVISTKLRISSSWVDLESVNWAQDRGQLNMIMPHDLQWYRSWTLNDRHQMKQLVVFRGGRSDPRRSANRLSTLKAGLEHRPVVVVVLMYSLKFSSNSWKIDLSTPFIRNFLKFWIHYYIESLVSLHFNHWKLDPIMPIIRWIRIAQWAVSWTRGILENRDGKGLTIAKKTNSFPQAYKG